jgi:hypothetical protein
VAKLENVVGVVQGLRGRTSDVVYDLFFAEKRAVAAIVLHFSDLADIYRKINAWTFLFGNLSERSQAKIRSVRLMEERRLAFKDKTLDEILALHRANVEILYDNVVSVKVKRGLLQTSLEFAVQGGPEKKISFWLEESRIAEVERVIKGVLPSKVR